MKMKYRHGFVAACSSTTLVLILLILWSTDTNDEEGVFSYGPSGLRTVTNETLLDFTSFKFLIQNNPCDEAQTHNLTAVQIVTSFAGNVIERNALRRAYPKSELARLGFVRVFLLANLRLGQSDINQEAIYEEDRKFSDLIQGNFYESYRNLTYKHAMGLKWASIFCPDVKFVVKMDDDILVNMYELKDLLTKEEGKFELMGYILEKMQPIRVKTNKWYVKKSEFRGSMYPNFLSGWLYMTTPQIARKLVAVAHSVPYFWIDDLFITGIVASKANVSLKSINKFFSYHPELFECCIRQGFKCGFGAGPTGGDNSLQISFQHHAYKCLLGRCRELPPHRTIESSCVAKRRSQPLRKGTPHFQVIKL